MDENKITLHGRLDCAPIFSHTSRELRYFTAPIRVVRLSGVADVLNLILPERLVGGLQGGDEVTVSGQVRTFNSRASEGPRLIMSVHVQQIVCERGEDCNFVRLAGTLCKPPVYRRTPLGRDICDFTLAVGRLYGRGDYIPCIAWGSLALRCGTMERGDLLALEGRMQSRSYSKTLDGTTTERTAYEVSLMQILP